MTTRDVRDSHLLTLVPILAVLLPVSGALVMDSNVFLRIYEHEVMHLLSEIFCMIVALAMAGFMLLRYAGMRIGHHFWFGCSLLAQGILTGYHALNLELAVAPLFQVGSLFLGGLLASMVWLKPGSRRGMVGRLGPLLVVVTTTLMGMLLLLDPIVVMNRFSGPEAIRFMNGLLWCAAAFNLAAGVRLGISFARNHVPSLLWLGVFCLMTSIAAMVQVDSVVPPEGWLFHLLRVSSFTILLAYAATVSTREVGRLGHTESELRRSEARFKAITENTSDIIFVLDRSGVFTYVSPAAARVAGADVEAMIGSSPGSYTHDEDISLIRFGLKRATSSPGQSINIGTVRVRHADGRWMSVEGVYTCLYDDPSVEGVVMNYRDVTDRVTSESALEQSRQRMSRLISNLPGLVYRCRIGEEFPVEYVSDYSYELTGYKAMDMMSGKVTARDMIHSDDIEVMRAVISESIAVHQSYRVEYRFKTKSGEIRWAMERGVGIYDGQGEPIAVEGIIIDITDLVESRRELRRTKFAMENANDALLWIARDGRFVEANETACRYLGYSRSEVLDLRIHDIATDIHDDNWDIAWECVRREGATLIDSIYATKTGRRFPVEVSSIFLDFEGEEYQCCFVRDITERKEAERQIQKMNQELEERVRERTLALEDAQAQLVTSEKVAALGGLVAGVAHEINTPLGIGVTAASHLDEKVRDCERKYRDQTMRKSDFENFLGLAQETSGLILTNLRRAADLIQGFKQVSVDQSSERRRVFQLSEYFGEVIVSLRPEYGAQGHKITFECAEGLEMDSYPGSFAQVLSNLILNSVKHGFENRESGQIWINVDGDADSVRILYKDDGQGMDTDQVRRLYDPFYTTKRGLGGSGLGMNITYNLVTQVLKGTIECQSAPGQGTVFLMEFPRITPVDGDVPHKREPAWA